MQEHYEVVYAFEIRGSERNSIQNLPKRTFFVRGFSKIEAGKIVHEILQFRANRLNKRKGKQGWAQVCNEGGNPRLPYLQYLTNGNGSIQQFFIYAQVL